MAIPTNFLTNLLYSAGTPEAKFKLLKQFGFLSEYGLENRFRFLEIIITTPESRVDESGYGGNPNMHSGRLASEGFLTQEVCIAIGMSADWFQLSNAEREVRAREQIELHSRFSDAVQRYLRGGGVSIPTPTANICRRCGTPAPSSMRYCGSCGMILDPPQPQQNQSDLFTYCHHCNGRNGENTPLCEHCDGILPHLPSLMLRCAYCGKENQPMPFYHQCPGCRNHLKPLCRCPICGKYDRTEQKYDVSGCSHGIRVN